MLCRGKGPKLKRDLSRVAVLVGLACGGGLVLYPGDLRAQSNASGQAVEIPAVHEAAAPLASPPFWANRGRFNFGAQLGFALENDIPRNISHISLLVAQPQIAFIVRDFRAFPVQRFEIVLEGIAGNAIHPGGHLYGTSLLFRLDGRSRKRWVPFFDFGAGVQHTSLYLRAPELSGAVQFSPQGGPGVEFFFNPQRAIVLQYRYMHMSNAGIQEPNHGFNASMLSVGFRWLRRPRPAGWQPSRHSHGLLRYLFGAD